MTIFVCVEHSYNEKRNYSKKHLNQICFIIYIAFQQYDYNRADSAKASVTVRIYVFVNWTRLPYVSTLFNLEALRNCAKIGNRMVVEMVSTPLNQFAWSVASNFFDLSVAAQALCAKFEVKNEFNCNNGGHCSQCRFAHYQRYQLYYIPANVPDCTPTPRGGSKWGRLGRSSPLKPAKVTLITMILNNSENVIRDIRPFCRDLFCHSSIVKCTSSLFQYSEAVMWLNYQILLKITPPPNLTGWIRPYWHQQQRVECDKVRFGIKISSLQLFPFK